MKKIKQKLYAKWEVISTCQLVEDEYPDKKADDVFFDRVFQGNFVKLFRDGRCDKFQVWILEIKTLAKDDKGVVHEHCVEWLFDKPMSISEVLKGAKHIKVNTGGMKIRWLGVTKQWLNMVDEDLDGMDCLEAWCTASCVAYVKPENQSKKLIDSILKIAI